MTNAIHTEVCNGWTIEIVHDYFGLPRNGDAYGILVFFEDEGWPGGDEYIRREDGYTCPHCTGEGITGKPASADSQQNMTCLVCEGNGYWTPTSVIGWQHTLTFAYKARCVTPIRRSEHGPVSRYWPDDDITYDDQIVGFLIYTIEHLNLWGMPLETSDDEIRRMMVNEMREFTDWANGDIYGFVIRDRAGTEIESCWGYACQPDGDVLEDARAVAQGMDTAVPLYTVALEAQEVALLSHWVSEARSPLGDGLLIKLKEAIKEEE